MTGKHTFRRLLVGFFVSLPVFIGLGVDRYQQTSRYVFTIDMQSSVTGIVELFFDIGKGFTETEPIRLRLKRSTSLIHYRFPLPPGTYRQLRFDPNGGGGTFVLAAASIIGPDDQTFRTFPLAGFRPVQQISEANWGEDWLVITAPAGVNDPIVVIDYAPPFDLRPDLSGFLWTLLGLFVLTLASGLVIVMVAGGSWACLATGGGRLLRPGLGPWAAPIRPSSSLEWSLR